MKGNLPVKPCDLVILTLALGVTGFAAYSAYMQPRNAAQVLIGGSGHRWIFPLDAEETVTVSGPLGGTVVKIHANEAWVESSPCDNQVCVAAGRLRRPRDFAACLPNRVLVVIEGSDDAKTVDGTTW